MLIFLIGFMGAGKSFTGKHLSSALDIPFYDMDKAIASREGMDIPTIFETKGEPYFRSLETKFLRRCSKRDHAVIATGGGAPCHSDNMEHMNKVGVTIFLDIDKEVIVERLMKGIDRRPLLKGMNRHDLSFFYDQKMAERRPFYEKANFRVRHQDVEVLVRLLQAFLR